MENKVVKIFTVDFIYLLFFISMIFLIVSGKNILDVSYFLLVSFYYIELKLYNKKII